MPELIQLTEEQLNAVNSAIATVLSGGQLTIGGYAGTGKTTLIKSVLERLQSPADPKAKRLNVAVAAFTGKAVSVLRRKGVHNAQTLHSLMYEVSEDEHKQLVFRRRDRLVLGETTIPIDAVIVDEASMISQSLYDDLQRFGLPLLFVGDHGQLDPIGDNPGVMVDPQIKLEKIHRQAAASPILKAAHAFREGQRIDWATVPPGCGLSRVPRFRVKELCAKVDVILCGFNRTRTETNALVREKLGWKKGPAIVVGERLICLKNDRQRGVFNGMGFTVKEVIGEASVTNTDQKLYECWEVVVLDEDIRERRLTIYLVGADEKTNEINTKYWGDGEYPVNFTIVDYGYCLTVHKAQGSEFPKVLVIEELHPQQDAKKWRYTAATRASQELIWV